MPIPEQPETPIRIAVLADTHLPRGGRALPAGCVAQLRAAQLILHAGDISTLTVLDELAAIGPPVHAVHGNVDEPALRNRLAQTLELELGGVRIALTHDAGPARGRLSRLRRRFPLAAAVVFGHSHLPLLESDDEQGFQIFNPGSPTERRRAPCTTMGLARIRAGAITFEHLRV